MKTDSQNPQREQERTKSSDVSIPVQELMLRGLFEAFIHNSPAKARGVISAQCLAALLANPNYAPQRQAGEELTGAYASRAIEYADALIAELEKSKTKEAQ